MARKELAVFAINDAVDGGAEGPAQDCVDQDAVAESNADTDGGTVRKRIRQNVSDNGAEQSAKVGWVEGGGVGDGSSEANWFEWVRGVVKGLKGVNAGGVGFDEGLVKRVQAAVEAGASVEKGGKGRRRLLGGFPEGERDGGEGVGDGNWNGAK